jgi:hypothetical protein
MPAEHADHGEQGRQQRHGDDPARKRGATTRVSGLTAIISMPASCSVAFIRPISAVSAEPARPANSSAVTTGPSSRTSDSATTRPSEDSAPKSTRVL